MKSTKGKNKPHLTETQVTKILKLREKGWSIVDIAKEIGCHRQTVRIHLSVNESRCQTWTVNEAARVLGIDIDLCKKMIDNGTIPALKFDDVIKVPKKGLDRLLEEGNLK